MPVSARVPLVDLTGSDAPGPDRDAVVATIAKACTDVGFLVVRGHGVADEAIREIESAAREFFALPEDEKLRCTRTGGAYRGFTPAQRSALAASRDVETPPDLCELFTINRFDDPDVARRSGLEPGREAFFAPNVWPDEPERFRGAFERYYGIMEELAARLMRLMALALDLDEDWFADKLTDHITNLTVNHYPEIATPPAPGQLRRGEHSDWGSLTILYTDGEPGLQIRSPAGVWEDIPMVPGAFVINLGDLMARWTNGRWTSTTHRVVVPSDVRGDRISIAFFQQPAYDALIECIPTCATPDAPSLFEPITSGEWIVSMLDKTLY
ncbi:MAG: 2-oxoglutarate and iron-dependent oxygenase domain-containing protein [Ilumatobacteraceae bacterium]|nr:2-oxoglutarate and iron-dependent oxygenase domain-containing protein [Ilumatobacteraceae bacterium]